MKIYSESHMGRLMKGGRYCCLVLLSFDSMAGSRIGGASWPDPNADHIDKTNIQPTEWCAPHNPISSTFHHVYEYWIYVFVLYFAPPRHESYNCWNRWTAEHFSSFALIWKQQHCLFWSQYQSDRQKPCERIYQCIYWQWIIVLFVLNWY